MRFTTCLVCLFLLSCSSATKPKDDLSVDSVVDRTLLSDTNSDGRVDSVAECIEDETSCQDIDNEKVCIKDSNNVLRWSIRSCQAGYACLDDHCVDECADDCLYNEERTLGSDAEKCLPYDISSKTIAALKDGSLHDLARKHHAWSVNNHFPAYTLIDIYHTTDEYLEKRKYGVGDSAIWTGTYLAAEALRALVTRSPDAEKNLQRITEAIHQLFDVNGHRGYLSRFTAPFNHSDPLVPKAYNEDSARDHKITYKNEDWFWIGSTSRDQYQGVMLGYAWAYQALQSETHKDLIRNDVIEICEELMKVRKIKVLFRINIQGQWLEFGDELTLTNVILNPTEYRDGKPFIQFGGEDEPTNLEESTMSGIREFVPNYRDLLSQLPLIGGLFKFDIYRSGSAIMLAAAIRTGILVTEGDPKYAAQNKAFKDYYNQNFDEWLKSIQAYIFLNGEQACWRKYYGLNIVMQPLWTLLRLEDDPARRAAILNVLETKIYPLVSTHKNAFFDYIYASQMPASQNIQAIILNANDQLSQFMDPPKHHTLINHSDIYEANPDCPGMSKIAIDVKDRRTADFIWQRQPFHLTDVDRLGAIYPGTDYLMAYWMARYYGWLDDDSKGRCLRWQKENTDR